MRFGVWVFVWFVGAMSSLRAQEAVEPWVLGAVNGAAPEAVITLDLGADALTGRAPCNRFGAEVRRDGEGLTVGPIRSTRMACPHLSEETRFFNTLSGMDHVEQTEKLLVLSGGGVWMVFTRRAP